MIYIFFLNVLVQCNVEANTKTRCWDPEEQTHFHMWVTHTHTHIKEDQQAWPYNEKYGDRHISTLTMCSERQGSCQSVPCLGHCHKHKSWPKRSHAWLHTHTLSHQLTVARSHRTFLLTQQGPARCSYWRDIHTNARTNTWTHTGAPACLTYRAEFLTTRTLCTLPSSLSLSFTHTHTHACTRTHTMRRGRLWSLWSLLEFPKACC